MLLTVILEIFPPGASIYALFVILLVTSECRIYRHLPRAQPNEGYRVTIIRILLFVNTINSRILIIHRILRWDWKQTRYIKMNILYF